MARIYVLFLVRCSISVVLLSFLGMRLLLERKHLSIPDLIARAQKNYYCVLGMTISYSDRFLMAESSTWWVVLSDSINEFYAWGCSWGSGSLLIDWILNLVRTQRARTMLPVLFVLHW